MGAMSDNADTATDTARESKREVFDALLKRIEELDPLGENETSVQRVERLFREQGEWVDRFNQAAEYDAQLNLFVETLAALLKQWVKQQIAEKYIGATDAELLTTAADEIEQGSDWDGLCGGCGSIREQHSEDCVVRKLRKRVEMLRGRP